MTDTPGGEPVPFDPQAAGWWLASDGRWYPPHLAPRSPHAPAGPAPSMPTFSGAAGATQARHEGAPIPWRQTPDGQWQYMASDGNWYFAPPAGVSPQRPDQAPVAAPSSRNTFSIWGIVLGCIGLLFLPPLFGLAGVVCSIVAISRGERLGRAALVVAIVGLVGGLVIDVVVLRTIGR
jgi:hypothetical protein